MIAGAPLGGAAGHWGAIGAMAASSMSGQPPPDPKDVKIKELEEKLRMAEDKVTMAQSRLASREADLDKANAVVDDQANQIVALRAKLQLAKPASAHEVDHLRRLAQIEDDLRASMERAEARCAQLAGAWPKGEPVPPEPSYFRRNETSL